MPDYDLHPLSLGEILDRTFSLYRRNFLLFAGITAIPYVGVLAVSLAPLAVPAAATAFASWPVLLLSLVVSGLAYLISQGATVLAVSEIYLGRGVSIGSNLRRVLGELGPLFGVIVLNALACGVAALALLIPGIYVMCRLLVCVPVALIEQRGPRDSLSRSFNLTRDNAGRSFVIFLLYFVLAFGIQLLASIPLGIVAFTAQNDPEMLRWVLFINQVASAVVTTLVQPVLLIATAVFYYDLRVRKEAFDLQFMMDPGSEGKTRPDFPSILS